MEIGAMRLLNSVRKNTGGGLFLIRTRNWLSVLLKLFVLGICELCLESGRTNSGSIIL